MSSFTEVRSKLELDEARVVVAADEIIDLVTEIFENLGCSPSSSREIAEHLADSNLCGMESHGLMRTLQYARQFEEGYMRPDADPEVRVDERGGVYIDGNGGHGVPAMRIAIDEACRLAGENGVSAIAVRNVGHTGRIGAFTEAAAERGFLCLCFGGGNRKSWRQVAPYGGKKAMLPTNPYSLAVPGGERGPVMFDFATSKVAGGWIYAGRSAGARLPDNVLMDTEGRISRDPEDYFRGGAILPKGGPMGYALALVAEIVAEGMLGPTETEGGWLLLTLDTTRYRDPRAMRQVAEEILEEMRSCPPAPGFDAVEIPGEREREYRERTADRGIPLPRKTWEQIVELSARLKSESG